MKKTLSILLALTIVFGACACGTQPVPVQAEVMTPAPETPAPLDPKSPEGQAKLIFDNLDQMKLTADGTKDKYAVTDLDHNGRLELFCVKTEEAEYITSGKIYEVNETYDGFVEVTQNLSSGATLPEVTVDAADTYDDNGTFSYVFKDVTRDGSDTSYTVNCALTMKNGELSIRYLGQEKTVIINGTSAVEYYDTNGNIIGPDEFFAQNTVNGDKSSTNFDWFLLGEAASENRMLTSYNIFSGNIQPAVVVPTPTPTSGIVIVTPGFLMITKNPTWETRTEGENCVFVADADNWDSCKWTFLNNGVAYDANQFTNITGCGTSGGDDRTLYVYNSTLNLNGWQLYCTFYGSGNRQTAQTNTVGFTINQRIVYNQTSGSYSQYGSDNYATAIYIPMIGNTVYVSPSICNLSGYPYDGCPCTVYYTGNTPTGNSGGSIYKVDIFGGSWPQPTEEPIHSCPGTIAGINEEGNTAQISTAYGTFNYNLDFITFPVGVQYVGLNCTVYYLGNDPMCSEVTDVIITG